MTAIFIVIACTALISCFFGYLGGAWWALRGRARSEASLSTLGTSVEAIREEALKEAQAWKEKAEANFTAIERIERQKNEWTEMYHEAGLQASAAQEMLLREIQRLSIKAKEPVRPHLQDLVSGYRETHGSGLEKQKARAEAAGDTPQRG